MRLNYIAEVLPCAPVTCIVNTNVPAVVGVPVIWSLARPGPPGEVSLRPGGSDPAISA